MNTVLIVEDEKLIRQGLKTMIQRCGVPVTEILECNNGQSALELLQERRIDVMFTDIRMPKMDGIELVKRVQELEDKPLIVAVSGYDDFSYAVEMLRGGVREYILKPVERDKIKAIMEKFESELHEKMAAEEEFEKIGRQQLKYVMMDEVTGKELQLVAEWFENMAISKGYYVICTEPQEKKEDEGENTAYLYWRDIEGSSVYIMGSEAKEVLMEELLSGCHAGSSLEQQGIANLKKGYSEAKMARKEAFCTVKQEVTFYQISSESHSPDAEKMFQIAQQIGTTRVEESLGRIRQMVRDTKRGKLTCVSFEENIKVLMDAIVSTYQKALPQMVQEAVKFRNIYSFSDIDAFAEELIGWLMLFHEKLDTQFDDYKNKQKVQEALGYIRENFDKDLNMAVVSNQVSMNYSLFSYVFKQYTGKNFVNYLKGLRVDEAKKLLAETDLRVVEISRRVGYENEKHFMKVFRNLCGVSPSEYRKNMQMTNQ